MAKYQKYQRYADEILEFQANVLRESGVKDVITAEGYKKGFTTAIEIITLTLLAHTITTTKRSVAAQFADLCVTIEGYHIGCHLINGLSPECGALDKIHQIMINQLRSAGDNSTFLDLVEKVLVKHEFPGDSSTKGIDNKGN